MAKPRLYDPRTGHRITAQEHRALVQYGRRQVVRYRTRRDVADDRLDRVRQKRAVVRWSRRYASAELARQRWARFVEQLEDQLKRRFFEFEMKFSYEGKSAKNKNWRATVNVRMRTKRSPATRPSDPETWHAYESLLMRSRAPKGWEFAVINWRNDHLQKDGSWRRGEWKSSDREADLGWAGNIIVGGDLGMSDMVIGEVEPE